MIHITQKNRKRFGNVLGPIKPDVGQAKDAMDVGHLTPQGDGVLLRVLYAVQGLQVIDFGWMCAGRFCD